MCFMSISQFKLNVSVSPQSVSLKLESPLSEEVSQMYGLLCTVAPKVCKCACMSGYINIIFLREFRLGSADNYNEKEKVD